MDYSQLSDEDKKRTFISMLIQIAKSDELHETAELRFIQDFARKLGLTEDDVYNIRNQYDQFSFSLPENENERMIIFFHLIQLMKIDYEIHPSEKETCKELGFKLGLNSLLIEDLIKVITQMDEDTPENIIPETIKKYLN